MSDGVSVRERRDEGKQEGQQLSVEQIGAAGITARSITVHHQITSLSPQEQRGVEESGGLEGGGVVRQLLGRVRRPQRELAGGQLRPRSRHVPPQVADRVSVVQRGHEAGTVVEPDLDVGLGRVRRYLKVTTPDITVNTQKCEILATFQLI